MIVFGVTGNKNGCINAKNIENFSDKTIFISGSSKRVEFDIESIKNISCSTKISDGLDEYTFCSGKKYYIANYAEPINLRYSVIPSNILDLVYSSLIRCINKIAHGFSNPGLTIMPKQDEDDIMRSYIEIYKVLS